MSQIIEADRSRTFIPSLEGVRGWAFLAVFAAHYAQATLSSSHRWWTFPVSLLIRLSWVSIPVFFVLSGFLICGILIDTRERGGYFKIFYSRRILRVFPLYYLTLAGVGLCCTLKGESLSYIYWLHFLYIHNLVPGYAGSVGWVPQSQIAHLWSMGIEEQFYLVWPLVVWFCPNRRFLLGMTLVLIGASLGLSCVAPFLNLSTSLITFWTPTRADAILLGAALAIIRGKRINRWFGMIAKYVALVGVVGIVLITALTGGATPVSGRLAAIMIPLADLTAAGIVVAVMQEGSFLYRVCIGKRICWLGARSYALYLFHFTYLVWFVKEVIPFIAGFIAYRWALLVSVSLAFWLTMLLTALNYRIIEQPAMNLKGRLRYGGVRKRIPVHSA